MRISNTPRRWARARAGGWYVCVCVRARSHAQRMRAPRRPTSRCNRRIPISRRDWKKAMAGGSVGTRALPALARRACAPCSVLVVVVVVVVGPTGLRATRCFAYGAIARPRWQSLTPSRQPCDGWPDGLARRAMVRVALARPLSRRLGSAFSVPRRPPCLAGPACHGMVRRKIFVGAVRVVAPAAAGWGAATVINY